MSEKLPSQTSWDVRLRARLALLPVLLCLPGEKPALEQAVDQGYFILERIAAVDFHSRRHAG